MNDRATSPALLPAPVLDGELLRAFVAFAEELHFTRAAARVGLSQPALFERVQRLGALLDAELYVRVGRGVGLTDRGRALEAYARDTLASARAFDAHFRGLVPRETVTLAAGEGCFLHLLPPTLRAVRARGDALSLLTLGARDAMAAVRAGRADVAVVVTDVLPDDLEGTQLFAAGLSFVLGRDHPLATRKRVSLRDVAAGTVILPPEGRPHRSFVVRAITRLGLTLARVVDADGWPLTLSFARAGIGVAVVNEIVVSGPSAAALDGLVVRSADELGTIPYWVVWRRGRSLPPAATRLIGEVRRAAEPHARRPRRSGVAAGRRG